jgi:excisionase family DNA binding protein
MQQDIQKVRPLVPLAHSVNNAATISGLSRTTLYHHIREGRLHSVLVGGRRLIPDKALRDLLQLGEAS